ncbi:MAG: GGDEF domain-containing protein, partial [Acidimicrobiales bacterium]
MLGSNDSAALRRQMGRAGAVMFAAGGLVVLVTLALPAWPHRHNSVVLGLAVLALVTALVLRLSEGRIPPAGYNPVTAAGSVVIATLIYYGGSPGSVSIYACLYIWVVVYACYFYPRPWALGHLGFAVVTLGAVDLAGRHTWLGLGGWLTMTAALSVAAGVVSYLISDLRSAARSDGLTGLANRQCFEEALAVEMARARRHPERHLTIALIDIDDFKLINDRHGHGQG